MSRLHALVFASTLGFVPAANAAVLVVNGDFESEPNFGAGFANDSGFSAFTGSQVPGWTITPGHAVTIHNNTIYPNIAGTYSVNADGEGFNGTNADFYQDVPSVIGGAYTISYQHVGWMNSAATVTVSLTDLVTNAPLYINTFGFTANTVSESVPFVGTGNSLRLHVVENGSGTNDNSLILDNFSIVGPVPEPAAVAPALAGLFCLRRRLRRTTFVR